MKPLKGPCSTILSNEISLALRVDTPLFSIVPLGSESSYGFTFLRNHHIRIRRRLQLMSDEQQTTSKSLFPPEGRRASRPSMQVVTRKRPVPVRHSSKPLEVTRHPSSGASYGAETPANLLTIPLDTVPARSSFAPRSSRSQALGSLLCSLFSSTFSLRHRCD